MGISLKPIPFYTDNIRIRPHTATDAHHLGRAVSLREFAAGRACSLYIIEETGELHAETGTRFMTGPISPKR